MPDFWNVADSLFPRVVIHQLRLPPRSATQPATKSRVVTHFRLASRRR